MSFVETSSADLELILVDRDDVVGAFAPKCSDDAFAVTVLPRGASGTNDFIKFESVNTSPKLVTKYSVLISMNEPGM